MVKSLNLDWHGGGGLTMMGKIAQSSSAIFCKVRNAIYRLMTVKMVANDTLKTLKVDK